MPKFLVVVLLLLCTYVLAGWEDEIIYMIMIDRFFDGNPANNDMGAGEYAHDNVHYNGGDLKGILEKLDYIVNLGVTTIWITPPVANQWWNPWVNYGGYHGYWARNFKEIDEHFGNIETYRRLVEEAHRKGLKVIQDIVCNHVGDYFRLIDGRYERNQGSVPTPAPTQYPFNMNDFNDPEHRKLNVYHWTPDISNYNDENQRYNYQAMGLDDLNTENPLVITALKNSYKFWIDEANVDGFRVDTVMYVPHEFWKDFLLSEDGILSFARSKNKDFVVFGEAWKTSKPFEETAEQFIAGYFEDGFNGMLDFPLCEEIKRVIKNSKPTSYLAYRLEVREKYLKKGLLFTFIDNHDMTRFLKSSTYNRLKMALTIIFTIPGVPIVYYGTEQGLLETRAAMFKEGFASGRMDHFDTTTELYRFIKTLSELRKKHAIFRYGRVKPLMAEISGPGVLVYSLTYKDEKAFVFMNTSVEEKMVVNLESGLEEGSVLTPLLTNRLISRKVIVKEGGKINLTLPPESFGIFMQTNEKRKIRKSPVQIKITNFTEGKKITGDFTVEGVAHHTRKVRVYFDRKTREYIEVKLEGKAEERWKVKVDSAKFEPGFHTLVAKAIGKTPAHRALSTEYTFELVLPTIELAKIDDPLDDDKGPFGRYIYPTDITFKRQMDMEKVEVKQIGTNLVVSIIMREVTRSWAPPFGFDHVTFQIFIDRPDTKGKRVMPYQNATVPEIMDWDYEIFATGWEISMYSSEGAENKKFGKPLSPAPEVRVEDRKISFIVKGSSLGNPTSFDGWKIYVTTWDYDGIEGRFRPLAEKPGAYIFGGGEENDPYIMDDAIIICSSNMGK